MFKKLTVISLYLLLVLTTGCSHNIIYGKLGVFSNGGYYEK